MTQFVEAALAPSIPAASRAGIVTDNLEFCRRNGTLKDVTVIESSAQAIVLRGVGSTSGTWLQVSLGIDAAGQINSGDQSAAAPPPGALPRDLGDASLQRRLRATVRRLARSGAFSGIVAIARGPLIIASATAGYADRARHSTIDGATQFTLGSMGKLFTATAIGQLIDRGQLSLDDKVGKFFPDYANVTVRDQVSVGMLLSHTAGMGNFLAQRTPAMMSQGVARAAEFMPLYEQEALQFPPGTAWAYSNSGLALAGAIVEIVSGEDYPAYLRDHIFVPAGMHHSDPNYRPHAMPSLVTPYTPADGAGESGPWTQAPRDLGSPAGGAISSADDLVRFADALRNGTLMRPATLDALLRRNPLSPADYGYGNAFEIETLYGQTLVGHSGGFPGVVSYLHLVLGSPYTVVVLANQDGPRDALPERYASALVAQKARSGQ